MTEIQELLLERMIGNRETINDAIEQQWKEKIHAIRSAGISMGAEKLFDRENAFMQCAYDMTLQGLEKWPEKTLMIATSGSRKPLLTFPSA